MEFWAHVTSVLRSSLMPSTRMVKNIVSIGFPLFDCFFLLFPTTNQTFELFLPLETPHKEPSGHRRCKESRPATNQHRWYVIESIKPWKWSSVKGFHALEKGIQALPNGIQALDKGVKMNIKPRQRDISFQFPLWAM